MKSNKIFLLGCIVWMAVGCAPKKLAVKATVGILEKGMPAIETESEVDVARVASLVALKQIEAFRYSDPHNKKLLTLLARSYGSFSFGFLEEDLLRKEPSAAQRLQIFYARGRDYGAQALGISPEAGFPEWNRAVAKMGRSDLPALFWTAFNWGGLIRLKPDDSQNLVDFAKVERMMRRVEELDPNYFYGSVQAFFGSVLAMKPTMLGGNPVESKKRFEKAIAISNGKFLMHYVLYAQFYAGHLEPAIQKTLLQKVTDAPADFFPEQNLANQLAKRRAALLLR